MVVDAAGNIIASPDGYAWGAAGERSQEASDWEAALHNQLMAVPREVLQRVERIAVSGTSGSVLLVDEQGSPVSGRGRPRMYDFSVAKQATGGTAALELLRQHAPDSHAVQSATSALAKLLAYHCEAPLSSGEQLSHQADFVASRLTGRAPISDWHNALKLGFDVQALAYPEWLTGGELGRISSGKLPAVVRPGEPIGKVSDESAERYGLRKDCLVVGGTTDSIAAFLAAGVSDVGDAVTSLGSTVAIKLLSSIPVDDASTGVYSHRLGDRWLVGGASNAGCAVLREQGFSAEELARLSEEIDAAAMPPHPDYYPLAEGTVGERFPRPDEAAVAVLEPVPETRTEFLHCILHGIARVEGEGYDTLSALGASPLQRVFTSGGGSQNAQWTAMRQRMLGVPTARAANIDAAYGAALLAARGA
jgi:sugar (pentulose or hexulose) kinase